MVTTISKHEIPATADEVDLDRLVWDPVYREAVRHLIEKTEAEAPKESGHTPEVDG